MKTSCIRHPANEPLVVYRKWQLEACEGSIPAAIMLSFFEYWHNIKLEQRQQARKYNATANKHGEDGGQLETLIQWHTNEEIETHTGLKRHSISKAIALLADRGFISVCKNPNPRFAFDTTRHFELNVSAVNHWIENAETRSAESDRSYVENCNRGTEICNGPAENCKQPKISPLDFSEDQHQQPGEILETEATATTRDFEAEALVNKAANLAKRQIRKQIVAERSRNFMQDTPWGVLAKEMEKDPKEVFEAFRTQLEATAEKRNLRDPEGWAGKIANDLFQNPGSEANCKHWRDFERSYRGLPSPEKTRSASPAPREIPPLPETTQETRDRLKRLNPMRRAT
jgi:hypothetical protein